MADDEVIHLRVPGKIYKKLQKQADLEKRPLSNLMRFIIIKFAEDLRENHGGRPRHVRK